MASRLIGGYRYDNIWMAFYSPDLSVCLSVEGGSPPFTFTPLQALLPEMTCGKIYKSIASKRPAPI